MLNEIEDLLNIPSYILVDNHLPLKVRQDKFKTLKLGWASELARLGSEEIPFPDNKSFWLCRDLIQAAIDIYLDDPSIQEKYLAAAKCKSHPRRSREEILMTGKTDWENRPMLSDFIPFLSEKNFSKICFPQNPYFKNLSCVQARLKITVRTLSEMQQRCERLACLKEQGL